jgi:transposase-like protein
MAEPSFGKIIRDSVFVSIGYADALRIKGREGGASCMKSVYTALGVNFEGQKEVLGLWIAEGEGASGFSPHSGWAY